jgi:integrase
MMKVLAYAQTRLDHADAGFQLGGVPVPKMPLAVNDDEGLVVVLQAYLLEGCVRTRDDWRTAEKHGYALCQWYDYLRGIGVQVLEAHEGHLMNFLLGGGTRSSNVVAVGKNVEVSRTKTNVAKFKAIVSFYDFWQNKRGKTLTTFRGGTIAEISEVVFERKNRSISKAVINFSKTAKTKSKRRIGTPDDEDWDAIVNEVLDRPDDNRAQTYYLIGNLARRSGSRGLGIHGLLVPEFLKAIAHEKAFRKILGYRAILKNHLHNENRFIIVEALQRMKRDGRNFIYCDVLNKGGGDPVPIAIPIELAVEIFEYICTHRQETILKRFAPKKIAPPQNVFLSYKTNQAGGALTQEAMGNHFNEIFRELEIDGTFHKLRAAFCQEVVRDIYIRERAINGRAWQVNNVLEFARKLLGHKNPQSLEHYLNEVMAEEVLFGEPIMVETTKDVPYVRAVAARLSEPLSDEFRKALQIFMAEQGLEPLEEEGRRYALF